ncbi:hypothetical protein [Sphingobium ummariense]|uniref:Uncharacterized protein n=1 Tax=Sphingobium ummariense RL-3 TaxID=1346791 RepID=T0ISD0_9SPHN|nr:hypothetical protein [Sphingobium ummariense]EQB31745.1 hypothetical protein M529_13270 [Sphingobium ummariense RL-3]
MKSDLRALGIAHGLLLGLVLASPLVGPSLIRWGIEALFVITAFQLRLADRRWDLRNGWRGWVSHVRMAPGRLLPWAGIAAVALMAEPGRAQLALSVLAGVGMSELVVYPIAAHVLSRMPRAGLAIAMLLLLLGCGFAEPGLAARFVTAFALGLAGGVFWLRGPDGEARSALIATSGCTAALAAAILAPASLPFAFPAGVLCAALALAQLSVVRRRPLPWQIGSGAGRIRPEQPALPSPPA